MMEESANEGLKFKPAVGQISLWARHLRSIFLRECESVRHGNGAIEHMGIRALLGGVGFLSEGERQLNPCPSFHIYQIASDSCQGYQAIGREELQDAYLV